MAAAADSDTKAKIIFEDQTSVITVDSEHFAQVRRSVSKAMELS
jgi:hypothetical protein